MSKKKLSLSKKSILIASALILAIGIPLAYLLWSSNQEDSGAWYNSSWLYRRSISVANSGSTLTNEDVLIIYDTATLITASKLQSDCDDLRFVDSDDSTALAYWVEGGCNTSTTHIWVRIPSLPSGGKTIYMYYGNTSATNAEETWTSKFYLMKNGSCDTGWTTESNSGGDFYLKFPYPASTYGTTGGSSSHDHGTLSLTTGSSPTGSNTTEIAGNNVADDPHTHSVSVPVETNSSVLPTYLDMIFCSNNDLIVKQNTVAIFTSTVSSPFTQFSALDSAFPRGNSSYTGTQGGSTTHTHITTQATTGAPSATTYCDVGTAAYVPTDTHTHTFSSSSTTSGNHVPTYMTVIFGQAGSDTMAPSGTIVISNSTPPLGWTRYSALDGYFTYGATSYGTTGGNATHTHNVSLTSGNESATYGCVIKSNPKLLQPRTHTHTASGTTGTYSNNPPYISTLFIQKKTSQSTTVNNEEVPNQAPNAPSSLLTEAATNPTGVTDTTPEFSAVYSDPDSDDGTYYEIEVNTNDTFTGTVMWDSGQVSIGPITSGNRSSDISYGDTDLTQNGTTYYWRIRFWDDNGAVSNWSSTANFTMATANTNPDAPSSLYTEASTNPTKVTDTTPEFSAVFTDTDTGDTGVYYQIQVNTQSDFLGTSMWDSTQTAITPITNGARSSDIIYDGTTLTENGVTYYWRMKFWDNYEGESSWSSTAQFTMSGVPYAPSSLQTEGLTNPTGVTDTTPEFSAIHTDPNGDSTTHYEIEVNTLSNFSGTVMWDTGQQTITVAHNARSSDISYGSVGTPQTLTLNGSTYYWRIRFWDSLGVSDWSSTAQFTMYSNTTPNAPSSLYTEASTNPTKVTDTTPEFSAVFSDSDGGDTGNYYQIQVNTQSDFNGTSMWDSNQQSITAITNGARSSDISYAGTTLTENGVTYYWRMKFWDNYGAESNWSSTAQFTMSGVPYAPSSLQTEGLTNPTGVTDTTPEFSAVHTDPNGDSTASYQIQVNTQSDFLGTSMWDSTQLSITVVNNARSSDISYNGTTLTQNGATYYWRIKFWDTDSKASDWSSTGQFTMDTAVNTAPNAPSSLYTEGSSSPTKVTDTTPEFSAIFSDTDGSDTGNYYQIQVNTQSDFLGTSMWDSTQTAITPITNGARSSDISYAGTTLTENGVTYYWRMKFWDNNGGESNWSSTAQFTMSGPPNAPSNLKTDNMTNPTQILSTTPDFKAYHIDPNGDSATYYEIEVNTQSDFLGTSMWDTGQVSMTSTPSGQYSPNITYAGTTLTGESSTTYYWRIRFWDTISTPSEWSSTGSFVDFVQEEQYIQMEGVGLERIKIN